KRVATPKPRVRNLRVSNPRQRKQQHLLDVRVRSHKAVQHRNRRLFVIVSKVVLSALVCAALVFGVRYGAKQLFFENPDYRLSKIDVQTDGTLQRADILEMAEMQEGENIFSVNLARVQERLLELPQVDEVQVVRKMPSEIAIQIVERKPVAWITSEKGVSNLFSSENGFLVDARGAVMREKKLLPEYLGLPVIAGATNETLTSGQTVQSFEVKAALELLRLSTRSFMQTRFQVREIDVSKGYCLLVTDKNRTRVTFGFDDLDAQLQRLEQFLVFTDDSRMELETVNLLVQRNVPVTFAKPAAQVINDTIDPEGEEPKILRALPVNPDANKETAAKAGTKSKKTTGAEAKIRKAKPVERGRRN
ncbi:MAG: FtsQ-type POTRA domain-containing protein, partial [Chthoniobacterales bacterium]